MITLKNTKHELFAQLVANGKSPPQAYVSAGFSEKWAAQSANRFLKNADVALRFNELTEVMEKAADTVGSQLLRKSWVIEELKENVLTSGTG